MNTNGFEIPYPEGKCKEDFLHYIPTVSLYSKGENGVQILFGVFNNSFHRYGFLLSKSKDGVSADGGDAGIGGKGGGGGKAGEISVVRFNGSYIPGVLKISENGEDGRAGKAGRPGMRDVVRRLSDHLIVDGWGLLGFSNTYPGPTSSTPIFITVVPWEKSKKKRELGNKYYYCKESVSKNLNSSIDSDYIGFFRADQSEFCLTECYSMTQDGKETTQEQIIKTTGTKRINRFKVQADYHKHMGSSFKPEASSLMLVTLQSLEQTLSDQLKCQETANVSDRHCVKKICSVKNFSERIRVSLFDVNVTYSVRKNKSNLAIASQNLSELQQYCIYIIDPYLLNFFLSPEVTSGEKYACIVDIFQTECRKITVTSPTGVYVKANKFALKSLTKLLKNLLIPIIYGITFEDTHSIDILLDIVTTIIQGAHSRQYYEDEILEAKKEIDLLLIGQYRWCLLHELHDQLRASRIHVSRKSYLSKAICIYTDLSQSESINHLKGYCMPSNDQIMRSPGELSTYSTCSESSVPLSQNTRRALEILMLFINEINGQQENNFQRVFLPNILLAIEEEYKSYKYTITDLDLLFIMAYFQENMLCLVNKDRLENLFYEEVLSKFNGTEFDFDSIKDCTILLYEKQKYDIVKCWQKTASDDCITVISLQCGVPKKSEHESCIHELYVMSNNCLKFDDKHIESPDTVLIGSIDVDTTWQYFQQKASSMSGTPKDCKQLEEETISEWPHISDNDRSKLFISFFEVLFCSKHSI